jgi:hypothetical protein
MYGFEILVGPYAVAHLRLAQVIEGANGTLPDGRLKVYLADTLESPYTTPSGGGFRLRPAAVSALQPG